LADPITLGLMALSIIGSAVKGFSEQSAINKSATRDIENARLASMLDINALHSQLTQSQDAFNIQAFERQRQALRDQSRILASAGEAGVGGNSLIRAIANQHWDAGYDIGIHKTNLESREAHITNQVRGVIANKESRINTAEANMRNPWVGVGLTIPTAVANLYEVGKARKGGNR